MNTEDFKRITTFRCLDTDSRISIFMEPLSGERAVAVRLNKGEIVKFTDGWLVGMLTDMSLRSSYEDQQRGMKDEY